MNNGVVFVSFEKEKEKEDCSSVYLDINGVVDLVINVVDCGLVIGEEGF